MKSQQQFTPTFSCEFFPPRTDKSRDGWRSTLLELGKLNPAYFSCTYGAGGTTQEGTLEVVKEIIRSGYRAAPHITCIGSSREKISELLHTYQELGINRIVALRGDLPDGEDTVREFMFASDLVGFIRQQTGDHFHIEVAAYPEMHPQAASPAADLANLKLKVDAGADSMITQYFFNTDAYYRFIDDAEAAGISAPVVPGIMPITNCAQLVSFSNMCGAEIPRWIRIRLEAYGDDLESIRAFGLEVTTQMCQQLLDAGAPGLHFYTLNKAGTTTALWHNLGL
ncbi:MAG: methylenetetrahydrofolate reductase [NAD(P)H] [Gammaproteobacteria bacterium]|nr:MAG: methylenetetrahydrofolate reductase [NAD(P)H] [Gammaproteobacteria bacterium]